MVTTNTQKVPDVREILVSNRIRELTRDEKAQLLEARRRKLVPHLKYICMQNIGDIEIHGRGIDRWRLKDFELHLEVEAPRGLDLKSRCLLFRSDSSITQPLCLVGVSNRGKWLMVEVFYRPGHLNQEIPLKVVIREVTLDEILDRINFPVFWIHLSESLKPWVNDRRDKLMRAEMLQEEIEKEDHLFWALTT